MRQIGDFGSVLSQTLWLCNVQASIRLEDTPTLPPAVEPPVVAPVPAAVVVPPDLAPAGGADDLPKTLEEAHEKLKALMAQVGQPPQWAQQRIDTLTRQLRDAERGGEASKAIVATLTGQLDEAKRAGKVTIVQPSQDEIMRAAANISANNEYLAKTNKIMQDGQTAFPDFQSSVQKLHMISPFTVKGQDGSTIPNMPREFIEAVMEVDAPERVLHELALPVHNDEAARIMALPVARQGVALAKFAAGLKPEVKVSSVAAPPTRTVGGTTRHTTANLEDEKLPIADFMKLRETQIADRKKRA